MSLNPEHLHVREELVEKHLGLVHMSAKRFIGRSASYEDLFQIGCIGLLKAIDNFDEGYGVRFSTYAVPVITGEIKRFLRDDGMIKVSRRLKEINALVGRASAKLSQDLGRDATLDEISLHTGLGVEDILPALEANFAIESLDKTVSFSQDDGAAMALGDKVQDLSYSADRAVDSLAIAQILESFPERERHIIKLRYFEEMTQSRVASTLGISQVQVSRLEKKILQTMRELL